MRNPIRADGPYRVVTAPAGEYCPAGWAIAGADGAETGQTFQRDRAEYVCRLLNDAYRAGATDGENVARRVADDVLTSLANL